VKKVRIHPLARQYNYRVFWYVPDQAYVAEAEGFDGISCIHKDPKRALKAIKRAIQREISWSIEDGDWLPKTRQMPNRAHTSYLSELEQYESRLGRKIDYQAQCSYIRLTLNPIELTRTLEDGINIDLDSDGKVVGIELIELDSTIPFDYLKSEFKMTETDIEWVKTLLLTA